MTNVKLFLGTSRRRDSVDATKGMEAAMRYLGLVLCILTLAACSKAAPRGDYADQKSDTLLARPSASRAMPAAAPPPMNRAPAGPSPGGVAAAASEGPPTQTGAAQTGAMPPAAPMLAYDYRLGLTMPAGSVRAAMERHQKACEDAGPLTCQVTSAQAQTEGHDIARATLQMRAAPV